MYAQEHWGDSPLTAPSGSISVYIGPSPRQEEKEMIDEKKNVQTTPPAPTASAAGPCPTLIQISRTPRHWKFTQHHRTTRPPRFCLKQMNLLYMIYF